MRLVRNHLDERGREVWAFVQSDCEEAFRRVDLHISDRIEMAILQIQQDLKRQSLFIDALQVQPQFAARFHRPVMCSEQFVQLKWAFRLELVCWKTEDHFSNAILPQPPNDHIMLSLRHGAG